MPQSDKEEGEDRAGGGKKGRWRPKRRREIERGKNLLLCRRSLPRSTAALCCSRQSGYHGRLFSRGLSKLRHRPLLLLPPSPFPKLMTFLFSPRFRSSRSTCGDDATSTVILLRRSIPLRSQTLRKVFFVVVPLPRFSPPSFVSFIVISDPLSSFCHFLNPI